MWPAPLKIGDTIALVSPSHVAVREEYQKLIAGMEAKGFRVKEAPNLYKHAYGYSASEEERAEDFNRMVADEEVKMIFFGGGYGENEILPLIDFEAVKKHPKIYMSYSDGTTILDAIYARTGLVTYYGQSPGEFSEVTPYTWQNFESRIVKGESGVFVPNSQWHWLREGRREGTLIGGYLLNIVMLLGGEYFPVDRSKRYILFLEDHEAFNNVASVSMFLAHISQSSFMENVGALLFGCYSDEHLSEELLEMLGRFGDRWGIPVAYCNDYGHGINHAILPIGGKAVFDSESRSLRFLDGAGVSE